MTPRRLLALAWCEFQPRTQNLAAVLEGEAHFVDSTALRAHRALLPFRYLRNALATLRLLERRRPQVVIAVSPPVFAPLLAWAWCRFRGATLFIDCHTDAFSGPNWAWSLPLHRWLGRRVRAVSLHTELAVREALSWPATAVLLPDDVPGPEQAEPVCRRLRGTRVVIAGALDDQEPVAEALAAADRLPEVEFLVTGDPNRLSQSVRSHKPPNVVFTGWLSYGRFLGELAAADLVAAFSRDPRIMNRAAFEAVGLGRPLLLSDHPGLRERFKDAAAYSSNSPAAMAAAFRTALAQSSELAQRSRLAQARLLEQRKAGLDQLRALAEPRRRSPAAERVLMVSQHPYPAQPVLRRNVEHLLRRGVGVDLVCVREPGTPRSMELPAGLRMFAIPLAHRRLRFWYGVEYLVFFARALPVVSALAIRRSYGTVQVDTLPDFLVWVALVPRLLGARVVLYMYELMPEMTASRLSIGAGHPVVRLTRALERWAAAWADQVVTVSDTCRRVLESRGIDPTKISVVPNTQPGVASRNGTRANRRPLLVTHATLIERYGVQIAIRALALLRDRRPELRLEVLGSGEYRKTLVLLVSELGLEPYVTFTGFLPWPQARERISRATIGLVPVIADGYGELLLPNKLFDYIDLRIPVVCARLPSIEEHFPDDALAYFTPGDPAALAAQVDRLLTEPRAASRQATRAWKASRTLRWENVSARYDQALAGRA